MNIKFKKIDNPLPMILEAYIVSKDGEYKFIDKNSLDNEQKIRLEAVASTTDVQNMYKALKKNIESLIVDDVELADKYKDFVDGDIKLKDPKLTQESLDAKKSNSEKDDVIQESTANDVEGSDAADQSE